MEALLLAGGKGERLGEAAEGRPKPLVPVGGRPLAAYQVVQLARAGATRVIVACSAGFEQLFQSELGGLGPEVVTVGEREPLGRGGGLRLAAAERQESGPVFALNGDELLDLDLARLRERHGELGGAATIVVSPLVSHLGVVDLEGDTVTGIREGPK
ncbi:MAG: NTP transferase domain-containing protein, partial [Actinomycetota bacterium]|nr:NTP transferase domain-containing protein [Actinomycetota bacterium]